MLDNLIAQLVADHPAESLRQWTPGVTLSVLHDGRWYASAGVHYGPGNVKTVVAKGYGASLYDAISELVTAYGAYRQQAGKA